MTGTEDCKWQLNDGKKANICRFVLCPNEQNARNWMFYPTCFLELNSWINKIVHYSQNLYNHQEVFEWFFEWLYPFLIFWVNFQTSQCRSKSFRKKIACRTAETTCDVSVSRCELSLNFEIEIEHIYAYHPFNSNYVTLNHAYQKTENSYAPKFYNDSLPIFTTLKKKRKITNSTN